MILHLSIINPPFPSCLIKISLDDQREDRVICWSLDGSVVFAKLIVSTSKHIPSNVSLSTRSASKRVCREHIAFTYTCSPSDVRIMSETGDVTTSNETNTSFASNNARQVLIDRLWYYFTRRRTESNELKK